jgi:hypothetical protein
LPDQNTQTALTWGRECSDLQQLPASLADVSARVNVVEAVSHVLRGRYLPDLSRPEKQRFFDDVFAVCNPLIVEPLIGDAKVSIGLRMWSGCLSAAETIASASHGGVNTTGKREYLFGGIDEEASHDAIFRAGVEAAPPWKRRIGQGDDIFLEGVPGDSPVCKYWSAT